MTANMCKILQYFIVLKLDLNNFHMENNSQVEVEQEWEKETQKQRVPVPKTVAHFNHRDAESFHLARSDMSSQIRGQTSRCWRVVHLLLTVQPVLRAATSTPLKIPF